MKAVCTVDNLSKLGAKRNVFFPHFSFSLSVCLLPRLYVCVCVCLRMPGMHCSCAVKCSDQERSVLLRPSKWYHSNPLL